MIPARRLRIAAAALAVVPIAGPAGAHPHVFAEARLELVSDGTEITAMQHVWRFDDLFSSTIILEFDANGDAQLDDSERAEVSKVVKDSMSEFNFFQSVDDNGKDIDVTVPGDIIVDVQDNIVTFLFETVPTKPVKLAGRIAFGVYDPTFYTAIDFYEDTDMAVNGAIPAACHPKVVRPDPDEALAQNQQSLTDAFFNDPAGTDMSKIFATRLEIKCG
ncbi:MAG: DUF1007 family protein [Brucellaceae bacterium]|nr:DUF1007 family protein [Brucellaceae bacterium]